MRYKGRESALGIGRELSIIRPGATTVVAVYSVGSMTTKGQMTPTSRVSIMASQATNGHEHTIVSSILTDLDTNIFEDLTERNMALNGYHK